MTPVNAYADAVVAFVDKLLVKGSGAALAVTLRIDINNYNDEDHEPPSVGGFMHLACHAPSNYIGVYAAVTERAEYLDERLSWTCIGRHDSGWRQSVEVFLERAYQDTVAVAERTFGWPVAKLSVYLHLDDVKLGTGEAILGAASQSQAIQAIDIYSLLEAMPR